MIDIAGVSRPSEDPKWLVEYFQKHIQTTQGDILLDLGCGTGVISLLLAQAFPKCHVHGMDINKELILMSKQNAKLNNLTNCTFECIDILNSEISEKYNHIITNPPYHRTERGFNTISQHKSVAHGATITEMKKWVQKSIEFAEHKGTITILQHTQNLNELEPLYKDQKHQIHKIQTSPQKPPKRFIINIEK